MILIFAHLKYISCAIKKRKKGTTIGDSLCSSLDIVPGNYTTHLEWPSSFSSGPARRSQKCGRLGCSWRFVVTNKSAVNPLCISVSRCLNCIFRVRVCAQSCPALCDPMDCSPPGSSVHGISQARIQAWVAIPFSRGSSRPRDQTHVSCISCISRQILYHCTTCKATFRVGS